MRASIAARKAAGTYRNRPPEVDGQAVDVIVRSARTGRSLGETVFLLDTYGLEPPRSSSWGRSTVRKVLVREGLRPLAR